MYCSLLLLSLYASKAIGQINHQVTFSPDFKITEDIDCSSTIVSNSDIIYKAAHKIILRAGFEINLGSTLELSAHSTYGCN